MSCSLILLCVSVSTESWQEPQEQRPCPLDVTIRQVFSGVLGYDNSERSISPRLARACAWVFPIGCQCFTSCPGSYSHPVRAQCSNFDFQCIKKQRHHFTGKGPYSQSLGWDGWMVSPSQWTWVWISSGSWWWTAKSGVLQSVGSQRARHDWATELVFPVVMYGCESWTIKKAERQRIDDFELWCYRRLLRVFWAAWNQTSQS